MPHYYMEIIKYKHETGKPTEIRKILKTKGTYNCEIRQRVTKNNNNRSFIGTSNLFEES